LIKPERRHDLDALRAFAMLLGIALHAALDDAPGIWVVQDPTPSDAAGVFLSAIHGFRMPAFFLMSGFFTAMLWRRRGLGSLLWHRTRRILLPLAVCAVTIIPLTNWVIAEASAPRAAETVEEGSTLHAAVRDNDVPAVLAHLRDGADINAIGGQIGQTPLSLAALFGSEDAARALIDAGADVNARTFDGHTALHNAAFLGHAGIAEALIDAGAEIEAENPRGIKPADSMRAPWAITRAITNAIGIPAEEETVTAGREQVALLLGAGDGGAPAVSATDVVSFLMNMPLLNHLWFLWHLCWLVVAFAIVAFIADRVGFKLNEEGRLTRLFVGSPLCLLWLIPLTMVPQSFMGREAPSFGPDTSAGVIPMPHVLAYYAVFFFVGALHFEAGSAARRIGTWWWLWLTAGIGSVFWLGLRFTFAEGWAMSDVPWRRAVTGLTQVVYAWTMCFAMIGLFSKFLSEGRPWVRYVSDASYWLYIAHLPLVIWLQAMLVDWQAPAIVKGSLIVIITFATLMASYAIFVRRTPIGWMLNGRKRTGKPEANLTPPANAPAPAAAAGS